jgi:hypothetical protein
LVAAETFDGIDASADGQVIRHAIQEAAHVRLPNGGGLARQNQESRLENIFGVLLVTEHAVAHAQHHRPVPPHQQRERRLIVLRGEALQELMVAERTDLVSISQMLDVPQQIR